MLMTIIPAEPRWFLARFCFVIGQDICSVQPLGVIVEEAALLVEAVGAEPVLGPRLQHKLWLGKAKKKPIGSVIMIIPHRNKVKETRSIWSLMLKIV